jgi:DNA (cytosine-5)-methyltransferase 1
MRKNMFGCIDTRAGSCDRADLDRLVFDYEQNTVRKPTTLETERLLGFPDGYTDIPGATDTARYKAIGNSWAVPVAAWIGKRINEIAA